MCIIESVSSSCLGEEPTFALRITWKTHRVLKKWLHSLDVCTTQLSKEVPINICLKTTNCWHVCDFCIIVTDILCSSHACQHHFHLSFHKKRILFRKFLILLESPDRHSLLVVIPLSRWPAVNTPKPPDVRTVKKNQRIKGRGPAGQLTEPQCPVHCRPEV